MRKLKLTLITLFTLFAILSPFVFTFVLAVATPSAFGDTFVGILDEKFERLNTVQGEKIVVIGGSSVAFGLDSQLLEKYVGMPVVNFGLYAALGTRLMLDLSLSGIGEGDVVVIAPEIDRQTLSLYFNQDTAWRAMEGNPKMLRYVGFDNIGKMAGGMFGYVKEKLTKGDTGVTDGSVYLSKFFDEYGDYSGLARPVNTLFSYYDENTPVYLSPAMYGTELDEFLDYVNSNTKKCARRGATVYFSFSPINALAVAEGADIPAFVDYLAERLDCDIITDLSSKIMGAGYFYDTNFHLNDTGVIANTLQLARDVKLAEGIITGGIVPDNPEEPELPEADIRCEGFDENEKYFTFDKLENGAYTVTGLTELGRMQKSLTLPLSYNNYKVMAVSAGALSGGAMTELVIPQDTNIVLLSNGCFMGTENLSDLYIHVPSGDLISPPIDFYGTAVGFRVHVPEGSDFADHYFWGERKLTFVFDL